MTLMLASGVPLSRSDMSAVALLIMALVVVFSLAVGLVVVYLAARPPRRGERPGQQGLARPARQAAGPADVRVPAPRGSAQDAVEPAGQAAGTGASSPARR